MLNSDFAKEFKDLQAKLNENFIQLKNSILNHEAIYSASKLSLEPTPKKKLDAALEEAKKQITKYGLEQKDLVEKLRTFYKNNRQNYINNSIVTNGGEEKINISKALNRAKKQNIITRTTSVQTVSPSDESEVSSNPATPEESQDFAPLQPQDLHQAEFLSYFGLVTHDVYKEIQNKRAERKRRRTANPQFLYTKGWDISKRKRNLYLASNLSPPHTRQSVKKQNQGPSPPFKPSTSVASPNEAKKFLNFNTLANFPNGLTIGRISQARTGAADCKVCNECKESTGTLIVCDVCFNGFHVRCHNRPLVQQPKHCPKCFKDLGINSPKNYEEVLDLSEQLRKKQALIDRGKELAAEMTQLQDKHSQMTISLKNQGSEKEHLLDNEEKSRGSILKILSFVKNMQNGQQQLENGPLEDS